MATILECIGCKEYLGKVDADFFVEYTCAKCVEKGVSEC